MITLTKSRRNESWHDLKRTEIPRGQDKQIFDHLQIVGPMTSRELHQVTGIERTSVVRSLNTLVKQGRVDDSKEVRCPVTGKNVTLYRIKQWGLV
jgi:predicted transcriptional regulator